MGKRSWLKDRSNSPERTPAGNSPYFRPLNLETLEDTSLAEGKQLRYTSYRKKKRLDPGDFVAIKEGFHTVDICHHKCAGKLIAIMSEAFELPQETWERSSLPLQKNGIPIKYNLTGRQVAAFDEGAAFMIPELHCVICDGENPDWIYIDEGKAL